MSFVSSVYLRRSSLVFLCLLRAFVPKLCFESCITIWGRRRRPTCTSILLPRFEKPSGIRGRLFPKERTFVIMLCNEWDAQPSTHVTYGLVSQLSGRDSGGETCYMYRSRAFPQWP